MIKGTKIRSVKMSREREGLKVHIEKVVHKIYRYLFRSQAVHILIMCRYLVWCRYCVYI